MRPTHFARKENEPSPLSVYRYSRDMGSAEIDVSLLSLADLLATYGASLPQ